MKRILKIALTLLTLAGLSLGHAQARDSGSGGRRDNESSSNKRKSSSSSHVRSSTNRHSSKTKSGRSRAQKNNKSKKTGTKSNRHTLTAAAPDPLEEVKVDLPTNPEDDDGDGFNDETENPDDIENAPALLPDNP